MRLSTSSCCSLGKSGSSCGKGRASIIISTTSSEFSGAKLSNMLPSCTLSLPTRRWISQSSFLAAVFTCCRNASTARPRACFAVSARIKSPATLRTRKTSPPSSTSDTVLESCRGSCGRAFAVLLAKRPVRKLSRGMGVESSSGVPGNASAHKSLKTLSENASAFTFDKQMCNWLFSISSVALLRKGWCCRNRDRIKLIRSLSCDIDVRCGGKKAMRGQ
mmetsp:Transcript_57372/g.148090  ORF Transcript_57372/g.148090 Transcript_57372/m.148090 type:complete len:219 (+) Transcript_57372:260-916(+)